MKKKTIKSYFINDGVKNPAINTLFCFSKRALKQIKQQKKKAQWIKNTRKSKKTIELIRYYLNYKNKITTKIKLNQWTKTNKALAAFFLKSYYFNKKLVSKLNIGKHKNYTKKQFKLWLRFKNTFFRTLKKQLVFFPRTGVLSSHFVHILSRKNTTYQTRSKYRAKTHNLNFFNYYFYFFTKFIYTYINTLNNNLYYFSSNATKRSLWVDDDFYTHTSNWHNNTVGLKKNNYVNIIRRQTFNTIFNINTVEQNNNIIMELYQNKYLINIFFVEEDQIKREAIQNELTTLLSDNTLAYIHLVNMFIFSVYSSRYKSNLINLINKHILQHNYLFKLHNVNMLNSNDIQTRSPKNTFKKI